MELSKDLLIQKKSDARSNSISMDVKREEVGFQFVNFRVHRFASGESQSAETGANELCIVMLAGRCLVASSHGKWDSVGGRGGVFEGMPHALYLPVNSTFTLTAQTACEAAFCYCKAEQEHTARLITPTDIEVEIRGGGNATRQIHKIIGPEFPAHRLLVVEVYTPSGNWSSYPPHKHDVHNPPAEVDLEEIYYYRIDRPEGYAIQRVYTGDRRLDATLTVRDGELVLIPEGYHPVVAAHGYNVYYLNVLAGSARSMAASDDPEYAWVRQTWSGKDPRLPLFQRQVAK